MSAVHAGRKGTDMTATTHTRVLPVDPSPEELRAILNTQRAAYLSEGVPSAEVRRSRIDRLALAIAEHANELAAALEADFGRRPLAFSLQHDVTAAFLSLDHLLANLEKWMQPETMAAGSGMGIPVALEKRPKGVVGVIGPWNFPISLLLQPAFEALAAGNRVLMKVSEVTERTADVLARAVATRLSPDEVSVVRGGRETAVAFSELPLDHVFFTGSPAVGRKIAAAAGRNLVPVTLELGGKNPVVVSRSADLQEAAQRIAAARMFNGGQFCMCPDYVFVPRESVDAFVAQCADTLRERLPEYEHNPDMVSIINDANLRRVRALVDDARAKGASVVEPTLDGATPADPRYRHVHPALVLGVTEDMTIAHEEIFGPVLVVFAYEEIDEAIAYIGAHPHPLVAYYFGDEGPEFSDFVARTTSGGVTRNDMALHPLVPDVPFGGIGQSGMGYYHGRAGFDEFTHVRAVAESALPFSMASATMPPYAPDTLIEARAFAEASRVAFAARVAAADGVGSRRDAK